MKNIILLLFIGLSSSMMVDAQSISVEGYAYETGNRGYLAGVSVVAKDSEGKKLAETKSDYDGKYELKLPMLSEVVITATKPLFNEYIHILDLSTKKPTETVFLKTSMKRAPGYIFEITLAEKREAANTPVDAIRGAWIEAYNNTTQKEVLSLKEHVHPDFKVDLKKGNHYTILIRKEGYLAKRLEAFVDVKGCILCFEGVGTVEPGVSDNLTEGNIMGTLLANVEMERLYTGKKIEVENIYYDLGKWNIKDEARESLGKIATFMKDNPRLNVELGSHTDVRGSTESNRRLSQKRARAAARYLTNVGDVRRGRITYKGYGESQIVNKCKEGVECKEAEHEKNRRTELKILGLDADQYIPKSLAQMKKEEQLEKMILALSDEEQIRIEDGGEIPTEIKEKIIEEKKNTAKSNELREFIDIPGGEYKAQDEKLVSKQVVVFEGTDIPKANVILEDKAKTVVTKKKAEEVGISESYTLPVDSASASTDESIVIAATPEKSKRITSETLTRKVNTEVSLDQKQDELESQATEMIEMETKILEQMAEEKKRSEKLKLDAQKANDAALKMKAEQEAAKIAREMDQKSLVDKQKVIEQAAISKVENEEGKTESGKDQLQEIDLKEDRLEVEADSMMNEESERLEAKKREVVEQKIQAEAKESTTEVTSEMPISKDSPKVAWLDGHKIVIHYGNIQLDKTHEIYERHVEVDVYTPQKGFYYYMVGSFETEAEASSYLSTYLSPLYPNAYVVEFDKGARVRN